MGWGPVTTIKMPKNEDLLADYAKYIREHLDKKIFSSMFIGTFPTMLGDPQINMPMTATEVRAKKEAAYKALKTRLTTQLKEKSMESEEILEEAAVPTQPMPMTHHNLMAARNALVARGVSPSDVSIVLPGESFRYILCSINQPPAYRFRFADMEILTGNDTGPHGRRETQIYFAGHVPPNMEPVAREVFACLLGCRVSELPHRARCNSVGTMAYSMSEIAVTPRPASGNNRNPRRLSDLSYEEKVVAAKESVAAYTRDKKLPSAEMLALYRELDGIRTAKKWTGAGAVGRVDQLGNLTISGLPEGELVNWTTEPLRVRATSIVINFRPKGGELKSALIPIVYDVDGNRHGLTSEALSRAADKVGGFERGGPNRDFIGAAAQSFAKMLD
jgi:hypothetical protein